MASTSQTRPSELVFADFRLNHARRRLMRGTDSVRLEGRAFDLLWALASEAGRVVTKDELTEAVWPGLHVSDGNLRVHLVEVRKALGEAPGGGDFITTVRGRGYSFVVPVASAEEVAKADPKPRRDAGRPGPSGPVFGRAELSMEIAHALDAGGRVTLVGPGGVGKTTAARMVVEELAERFDDVFFIDLSALVDPTQTLDTIAFAMGLAERGVTVGYLAAALGHGRPLLFLDGCEHLTPYLAPALSRLAETASELRWICTSREPIGYPAEAVIRLSPLEIPKLKCPASEAAGTPSVQLLLARMRAAGSSIDLDPGSVRLAAEICGAAGGIPLAIELAASQAATLGLASVAEALTADPFLPSTPGASGRSRLRATLEWSYQLLSTDEARAFRRLCVHAGEFSLDLATGMLGDLQPNRLVASLMARRLAAKSLLVEAQGAAGPTYRMLDTTRAFGREKLAEAREARAAWSRLARELEARLSVVGLQAELFQRPDELDGLRSCTNDVRGALAWCFDEEGDRVLGVALASASAAFFEELTLLVDLERWTRAALDQLASLPADRLLEARLKCHLGAALFLTRGRFDEAEARLRDALYGAEAASDRRLAVRSLFWLTLLENGRGDYGRALEWALRARGLSSGANDPTVGTLVECCVVWVLHWSGEQAQAYEAGKVFLGRAHPEVMSSMSRVWQSAYLRSRSAWARILWLVGLPEQACAAVASVSAELEHADDPSAVAISLISLSSVYGWVGDQKSSFAYADRAFTLARRSGLSPHLAVGDALRGLILVKTGEPDKGVPLVEQALERMQAGGYGAQTTFLRADLADGLARQGHFARAVALIDAVTAPLEAGEVTMASPEIFRVKGAILELVPGTPDDSIVKAYETALALAERQSALGWSLKVSLTFAAFLMARGRPEAAVGVVGRPYGRFTEGHETRDLMAARDLLNRLGGLARPAFPAAQDVETPE